MKFPLRMIIHAPQRKEVDFRPVLVELRCALTVDQALPFFGYDLSSPVRPTKLNRHKMVSEIANQIRAGYSIAVWDTDRLLSDLSAITVSTLESRPRLADALEADWTTISDADEETLIDLRGFSRLPNGHFLKMVSVLDWNVKPPRGMRKYPTYRAQRPRSEEYWTVLLPIIFERREVEAGMSAYNGWVSAGRPKPPKIEAYQ